MTTCEVCGEELKLEAPGRPSPNTCWQNAAHEVQMRGGLYVEGWAVRPIRSGGFEAFEHGWVEHDGNPYDGTPHSHAVAFFAGIRTANPLAMGAQSGVDIPLFRGLTCSEVDGQPNPRYDASLALAYQRAQQQAHEYCQRH